MLSFRPSHRPLSLGVTVEDPHVISSTSPSHNTNDLRTSLHLLPTPRRSLKYSKMLAGQRCRLVEYRPPLRPGFDSAGKFNHVVHEIVRRLDVLGRKVRNEKRAMVVKGGELWHRAARLQCGCQWVHCAGRGRRSKQQAEKIVLVGTRKTGESRLDGNR